jgi:hypothetical protein
VTGGRGRRSKQLLKDLKEETGYWNLSQEALGGTVWTASFGRDYRPVVRLTTD